MSGFFTDEKRKGEAKSALIADYAKPLNAKIQR
jgi:hypothetical protein